MYLKEPVIVLRRECYSRTSLRLSLWGKARGLLVLIARGMLRARNNRLGDLACEFDTAEAVYYRRPGAYGGILTEYAATEALAERFGRGSSLSSWYAALAAVRETVINLWGGYPTEAPDAPRVYAALRRFLSVTGRAEPFWAAVGGVLELLRLAGISPDLAHCGECGEPFKERAFYPPRLELEGLLCEACVGSRTGDNENERLEPSVTLDAGVLKFLLRLSSAGAAGALGLGLASAQRSDSILRLLEGWLRATIGAEAPALRTLNPLREARIRLAGREAG